MDNESAQSRSDRGLRFARLNSAAEIESCSFDEWNADHRGKGTILHETAGDWIIELSFKGVGDDISGPPDFWEISECDQRHRRIIFSEYSSEDEATKSFWSAVERCKAVSH
jgi:hypothetical protein